MASRIRKLLALERANIFSRKEKSRSKLFLILIVVAGFPLFIGLVLVLTASFLARDFYQDVSENVVEPQLLLSEYSRGSAKIYDRNGQFLYQFVSPTDGLRQPVPLSEISSWIVDATIAVEDPSFYTNNGLNITGIVRAAVENLLPWFSSRTNQVLEGSGGSSITQQLAKNIYIPKDERLERSYTRKLKETVVALELTRKYPKDDILVWYLNSISYGGPYVGIEAASLAYFGKKSENLTLAESALLAGIPQSPALYDPFSPQNFDPNTGQLVWGSPAKARQSGVLDLMVRRGAISGAQAEAAAMVPLEFQTVEFDIDAPHF
ncbi:MAG: transglycosylase domain-containing protein, partial [Dehalococcoidia bacterium]|nr:transglycosylase domain-containing protein [Dehalococcoidia bacterium]